MAEPPAYLDPLDPVSPMFEFNWNLFQPTAAAFRDVVLPEYFKGHPDSRPEDLDKVLPQAPWLVEMLLEDTGLDVNTKEKVLEVALLRGGSIPAGWLDRLKDDTWGASVAAGSFGVHGKQAGEMLAYQKMAVVSATMDRIELFEKLSSSGDSVEHRQPATQLMHILLQEGGVYSHNEGSWLRDDFKTNAAAVDEWIRGLPPEERGRAMYAMYDAAASKDIAGGFKLESVGVTGPGPVQVGATFHYSDTHWEQVVGDIERKVTTEVKPEEVERYNAGLSAANKHVPHA